MYLLVVFASLILLPIVQLETARADDAQQLVAQTPVELANAAQQDTDTSAEEYDKELDNENQKKAKEKSWKTDGVDLIVNAFEFDASLSSSRIPGLRRREDTSFMSVSSIGIRSYHGRKSIGFSIGTPFVSGALQVPDSGAFHLGYQLDNSWQVGILAYVDFSTKVYEERESLYNEDEDDDEHDEWQTRVKGQDVEYGSSKMSTALGGWLDYRLLKHWHLQLALYQVRSVMRSSATRKYYHSGYSDESEQVESGIEFTRINFSFSRHFKLSPRAEFAPQLLVGFNAFYDNDYRHEEVNGERHELDFAGSDGIYLSITLGRFIYHL